MSVHKTTVWVIALTLCAGVLGLAFQATQELLSGDPLDRFEVISSTSDAAKKQHAVTFRYDHADSSARVTAAWLLSEPRAIGSKDPVRGMSPTIVWTADPGQDALRWLGARLIASVRPDSELTPDDVNACLFEERKARVCFDSKLVDIEVKP